MPITTVSEYSNTSTRSGGSPEPNSVGLATVKPSEPPTAPDFDSSPNSTIDKAKVSIA